MTGERRRWEHRTNDRYWPIFGDWWGNPDAGYQQEWVHLTDTDYASIAAAKRAGMRGQESDDFNIGVWRDGVLVATLWMDEIVDDDPGLMAEIVRSLDGTS